MQQNKPKETVKSVTTKENGGTTRSQETSLRKKETLALSSSCWKLAINRIYLVFYMALNPLYPANVAPNLLYPVSRLCSTRYIYTVWRWCQTRYIQCEDGIKPVTSSVKESVTYSLPVIFSLVRNFRYFQC